jgi:hypothetical protein
LPRRLRQEYGVRWGPLQELRLRTSLRSLKVIRPLLPAQFRQILPARRAAERVAA